MVCGCYEGQGTTFGVVFSFTMWELEIKVSHQAWHQGSYWSCYFYFWHKVALCCPTCPWIGSSSLSLYSSYGLCHQDQVVYPRSVCCFEMGSGVPHASLTQALNFPMQSGWPWTLDVWDSILCTISLNCGLQVYAPMSSSIPGLDSTNTSLVIGNRQPKMHFPELTINHCQYINIIGFLGIRKETKICFTSLILCLKHDFPWKCVTVLF